MDGLDFITAPPPAAIDPARADIACFAGFVARRASGRQQLAAILRELRWDGPALPALPAHVLPASDGAASFVAWLHGAGWAAVGNAVPKATAADALFQEVLRRWHPPALVDWWIRFGLLDPAVALPARNFFELLDVPVPVETWENFDALFAWEQRLITASEPGRRCDTTLGAAVRNFFLHGGRLAYIVRLGEPWPALAADWQRTVRLSWYLRELPPPSPVDRSSWRGVAHVFGLPGVSFLCVPDLPELFARPTTPRPVNPTPEGSEVFIECATRATAPDRRLLRGVPAPRCDAAGFVAWGDFVRKLSAFISDRRHGHLREIQLLAAVPLPVDVEALRGKPDATKQAHAAGLAQWHAVTNIETVFVQLVYPWLRTRDSGMLPGNVLAPDGLFAGLLAGSALRRGSWHSVMHEPLDNVLAVEPVLDRSTLQRELARADLTAQRPTPPTVREHVTVIGPTARGIVVLSDVTTSGDPAYRAASVNRLVVAILRAARVTGEGVVFANNGPVLWLRLRESFENLLTGFWSEGALLGATARDSFEVRCDRSTMTQADIDAGRLIVRLIFTAAQPIVRITVVFAIDENGQMSVAAASDPTSSPAPQAA